MNIEQILKHEFKNKNLLKAALTHGSVSSYVTKNYERLEFLGDRVLGMSVASLLYRNFPNEPEGNLSQRFTGLVCKETVAEVARELGLGRFMFVAEDDIRENENVLCDVCEAIIGAIYIDAGVEVAVDFVNEHWSDLIDKKVAPPKDAKTALQEMAHVKSLPMPKYKIVDRKGPEHEPVFMVEVCLGNEYVARGEGHNKKLAEFEAAKKMLELIS
ncbi:MAG: ribonuclease III [Alphaproteobacteria bacterium]|nr:ribonuclease III [Alphaproteobacteria bacterium]